MLEHLQFLPSEPLGSRYAYTNFGLTAAAVAVAEAAGSDWEFLSEQALYKPLGMTATSSRFSDFMARANRAYPHILVNGSFQLNPEQRQPDAQSPAGGVSSSVRDMARWMSLLLNEGKFAGQQFIASDALVPALTPQMLIAPPATPESPTAYYGYGFNISVPPSGPTRISHSELPRP